MHERNSLFPYTCATKAKIIFLKLAPFNSLFTLTELVWKLNMEKYCFNFSLLLHRFMVGTVCTNFESQFSQEVWPVWLNGWVFVHDLNGCGFKSIYSHLNFKFCACLEQRVLWHSGNYRVWIHSETPQWHDKIIQWKIPMIINVLVYILP